MKLPRLRLMRPVSDEEYVARIRQSLVSLDRARPYLVCFNVVVLVVLTCIAMRGLYSLYDFAARNSASTILFRSAMGALLGGSFGFAFVCAIRQLFDSFCCRRSERLMLKYHDALVAIANSGVVVNEAGADPSDDLAAG